MLIVQKFGGTSVGSIERMRNVAARCLATAREGHRVAVVVSAMSGETNRLLKLVSDARVVARVRGDRLRLTELPCWLCKDLMLLGIWVAGALKRTVVWRGNVLRIGPGSELFPAG